MTCVFRIMKVTSWNVSRWPHLLCILTLFSCLQVRGHHIAKLDPLGISCVDFDDAPCTVGFQNVGEKNNSASCLIIYFTLCVLTFASLGFPLIVFISVMVSPVLTERAAERLRRNLWKSLKQHYIIKQ